MRAICGGPILALGSEKSESAESLAVLLSGGLDSAILLGDSLPTWEKIHPLYIRCGHYWEAVELDYVRQFLDAVRSAALQPLEVLEMPVTDLYPGHWSLTGTEVPDEKSDDEAVWLPGRNVLLLSKGLIWCRLHNVSTLALGTLGSNPFPDATPDFFRRYQDVVNQAIEGSVRIHLPYLGLKKTQVMLRGRDLPLQLTFSCIRPMGKLHCGRCNKCAERRRAFADAGIPDRTEYAA